MKSSIRVLTVVLVSILPLVAFIAPVSSSSPLAANNLGGGPYTGSLACPNPTVAATGTGLTYNTVITGYPGNIRLTGSCDQSTLTLSATGDAITGSTLRCPTLSGTSTSDGVTVHAEVTGVCFINSFRTLTRWEFVGGTAGGLLTFTRPGG